jgi:hypothetical protein
MDLHEKNIDVIVQRDLIARARILAGETSWKWVVPIKNCLTQEENLDVEQCRKIGMTIATMLRAHLPAALFDRASPGHDDTLIDIVNSLEDIYPLNDAGRPDAEAAQADINELVLALYDWGDIHRACFSGSIKDTYSDLIREGIFDQADSEPALF